MKGIGLGIVALLMFAGGGLAAADAELSGAQAPDFVLKGVSGKNFRLSEYRGQVVLVSFWASWCGECRTQLENLAELHTRYAGSGLEMLAISLDRELDQVSDAARAIGLNFPALHDAGGVVGEEYDVGKLPYLLLIDQDGIVRQEFSGYQAGEETEYLEQARQLLAY